MDYHSMKRKELQALCKKHNIPANSANSVLADKLSELLNEKQKPTTRQRTCMKSLVETTDDESGVSKRQAKKVRFSPDNDLVEYELRSGKKQMAARRKCLPKKVEKQVVNEVISDDVQVPVKLTRSRVQLVEKDSTIPNNGKNKGKKAVQHVVKVTNVVKEPEANLDKVRVTRLGKRGAVQLENANESVEEPVVGRVRVTRSKAQTLIDDGKDSDVNVQIKKKGGKRVAKDVQNVEPVKDIMDIPVRTTRSRVQTLKEDSGKTVINSQTEKKRTRREMKATDQNSNSSNAAPKRKSLRTNEDKNEGEKVEVVNDRKVTRSKANLATKSSGINGKNEAVNKVEKTEENVGRKNVNRRKSVVQPEKTEPVLHLEEPVNHRDTRRKSVVQKASKTVGKKQAKGQSGNLPMIEERLEDKENEMKAVVNDTTSPKSRKRGANPIIEDQTVKTVHVSPIVESSKRSTRSGSKTEGKTVTLQLQNCGKEQLESSSKKRAKLGDHSENINKTLVSKLVNFELDEKVTETEVTPVINVSNKRFTRSAIRSEKKEPNQSAIKEQQHVLDAKLSSHKVGKYKHDPAVNTAPGRVTRSGIKQNAAISLSEKVDKKKQLSKSAHRIQPLGDVSGSESVKSTKIVEEGLNSLFEENDFAVKSVEIESNDKVEDVEQNRLDFTNFEDETVETNVSNVIGSSEAVPDAISDGFDVQNQEVNEKSEIFSEAVNSEKSDEKGVELTNSESMSKGLQNDVMVDEPVVSVNEHEHEPEHEDEDAVNNEQETNEHNDGQNEVINEPVSEDNKVDDSEANKDDTLEPLSDDDKLQGHENDTKGDLIVTGIDSLAKHSELEDVVDAVKEPEKEVEFEGVLSSGNGVDEIPILGKSDDDHDDTVNEVPILDKFDGVDETVNATKVVETDLMPSTTGIMSSDVEDLVLSGDDEAVNTNKEHESSLNQLTDNDSVTSVMEKEDDFNITKLFEPVSDPSSVNDVTESPLSGDDIHGEPGNATYDLKSQMGPLTGNDDDDDDELETELDSSNANITLEPVLIENVPVVTEDIIMSSDQQPEPEAEPENRTKVKPETRTEPETEPEPKAEAEAEPEPEPEPEPEAEPETGTKVEPGTRTEPEPETEPKAEAEPGVCSPVGQSMSIDSPQTHATAVTTADARQESIPQINNDPVSIIFGDFYGLGSATGVPDTQDDSGIEQKVGENVSPDMSNEQITLETEIRNVSTDKKEPLATVDHDLDGADELDSPLVENINTQQNPTQEDLSSQLMGDIGAHECPITKESSPVIYGKDEESPVGDMLPDSPISVKEDNRNEQEETQNASTSVDYWNYDDFQKPVSANENDDLLDQRNEFEKPVLGNESDDLLDQINEFHQPFSANESVDDQQEQSTKDDRVSDLQTSVRASSSIEEISSPAVDLVNSVKKLEQSARNTLHRISDQDVNIPEINANVTDEIFDWNDSSIKSLLTTPAVGQVSHVKEVEENASSRVFNGEENEIRKFEDFSNKLFEDEVVEEEKKTPFELKGDQYDDDVIPCEAAARTGDDASGMKDNSIMFEKKEEETQLKGSEMGVEKRENV